MGVAELDYENNLLVLKANIYCYGDAANQEVADFVARDIESHWNEPKATINVKGKSFQVVFDIRGFYSKDLVSEQIFENQNAFNNYFRIEKYADGNISFVDGVGCNTGYFKLDNLLNGSTTAAHEFGHSLGLDHPLDLDIRGKGVPGIMYPRGTIVDPEFQYDPNALPGENGGTLNPFLRKVLASDIEKLGLGSYNFVDGQTIVGNLSSVFHGKHQSTQV